MRRGCPTRPPAGHRSLIALSAVNRSTLTALQITIGGVISDSAITAMWGSCCTIPPLLLQALATQGQRLTRAVILDPLLPGRLDLSPGTPPSLNRSRSGRDGRSSRNGRQRVTSPLGSSGMSTHSRKSSTTPAQSRTRTPPKPGQINVSSKPGAVQSGARAVPLLAIVRSARLGSRLRTRAITEQRDDAKRGVKQ